MMSRERKVSRPVLYHQLGPGRMGHPMLTSYDQVRRISPGNRCSEYLAWLSGNLIPPPKALALKMTAWPPPYGPLATNLVMQLLDHVII